VRQFDFEACAERAVVVAGETQNVVATPAHREMRPADGGGEPRRRFWFWFWLWLWFRLGFGLWFRRGRGREVRVCRSQFHSFGAKGAQRAEGVRIALEANRIVEVRIQQVGDAELARRDADADPAARADLLDQRCRLLHVHGVGP